MFVHSSPPAQPAARRRMLMSAVAATACLVASGAMAQTAQNPAEVTPLEEINVQGEGTGEGSLPAARLKRETEAASRLGLTVR